MSTYNQCDGFCDEGTCDLCTPAMEPIALYSVCLYVERANQEEHVCVITRRQSDGRAQVVGIGIDESAEWAVRLAVANLRAGGTGCCNG